MQLNVPYALKDVRRNPPFGQWRPKLRVGFANEKLSQQCFQAIEKLSPILCANGYSGHKGLHWKGERGKSTLLPLPHQQSYADGNGKEKVIFGTPFPVCLLIHAGPTNRYGKDGGGGVCDPCPHALLDTTPCAWNRLCKQLYFFHKAEVECILILQGRTRNR